MRKVTVFSTTTNRKVVVTTDVTTWGQLKAVSEVRGLLADNMDYVVKETKLGLASDESVLPTGDFTVFMIQKKTKAGVISRERMREIIEEETDELVNSILERLDDEGDVLEDSDEDVLAEEAARIASQM
jgi:hypothetical protein